MLTPYFPVGDANVKRFFEESGYQVARVKGLRCDSPVHIAHVPAATLRAAAFYERLGFRRMCPDDGPLSLVPPGDGGWSPEILRVAAGRPGSKEREMPLLLLEPGRSFGASRRPRLSAVG